MPNPFAMEERAVTTMSYLQRFAVIGLLLLVGCNRAFYREQADRDVDYVIAQKSNDPRWALPGFSIDVDPRSRYYDPTDPDCPPMPEDDPASHRYLHCVDGKKGWKYWHDAGDTRELENPVWQRYLTQYAPTNDDGEVVLTLDSALDIAFVNNPDYQEQIETLYLSALDVTTERFRLDTQFFGGTDTIYAHDGALSSSPTGVPDFRSLRRQTVQGLDRNTLSTFTDMELRRRFATAGELVVGFANEFVWQFAGTDTNNATSLLNFTLVQPLLRGAGRDIALEQLTIIERAMLANLRTFQRYRRGFYTRIAIGEQGTGQVSRRGGFQGGTGLTGFFGTGSGGFGGVGQATGFGGGFGGGAGGAGGTGGGVGLAGGGAGQVGGYIGLLQSLQEIRNTETSLSAQQRTLDLLEASLEAGIIDLVQVDQFRQNIETERANLLQSQNGLQNGLENYITGTLGLPPDTPVQLDDSLIEPFQLIDDKTNSLQVLIEELQVEVGELPAIPSTEVLGELLARIRSLNEPFTTVFETIERDVDGLTQSADRRKSVMSDEEQQRFQADYDALIKAMEELARRYVDLMPRRETMEEELQESENREVLRKMVVWLNDLLAIVQEVSLVQARARLESVEVEPVELNSRDAFQIALTNRLDIMNNRASLVDSWRLIQFNADALQSNLDVFFEGDMGTVGNNPVKFRGATGNLRAGVRFDAPFTRLLERNNYRQQLISYQQDRRRLIGFYDGVHQALRGQLRNIEQLRINLEIQRRAVVIAIRRVDLTREELNEPQPPPAPGEAASQLGPTAAQDLLTALSDLRNTQNNFMSVYLNYYAAQMRLARDLGIMVLDEDGRWVETPLPSSIPMGQATMEELPLVPPPVPEAWLKAVEPPASPPPVPVIEVSSRSKSSGETRRR